MGARLCFGEDPAVIQASGEFPSDVLIDLVDFLVDNESPAGDEATVFAINLTVDDHGSWTGTMVVDGSMLYGGTVAV